MKRLWILMLSVILITGCTASPAEETPVVETPMENESTALDYEEMGLGYLTLLSNGEYDKVKSTYAHDAKMDEAVDASFYEQLWGSFVQKYGAYDSMAFVSSSIQSGYNIYKYEVLFETYSLYVNVVFDNDGNIAGINMQENTPISKDNKGSLGGELYTIGEFYPISGELVTPEGLETMPLVIFVHGSGASNRDEAIGQIKPFYDLAKGLQEEGIATFRYDKRAYVHQPTDLSTYTVYDETIDDAIYAYNTFKDDPRFNGQIYVLGHSLGGHLLPRIGEALPEAKGLIFMAANYSPITTLLPYQVEYLSNVDGNLEESEKVQIEQVGILIEQILALKGDEPGVFLGAGSAYWYDLNNYKPGELLNTLDHKLLFIQGELDYQVPADELTRWLDYAKEGNATYHYYPTLSHLMTEGSNPPSNLDYAGEKHVDQKVIQDIASWVNGQ